MTVLEVVDIRMQTQLVDGKIQEDQTKLPRSEDMLEHWP
jgi:hypothetical protein